MTLGRPRRGSAEWVGGDQSARLALLVFGAAGLLLAVPAAEVQEVRPGEAAPREPDGGTTDASERLGGRPAAGPWLRWERGGHRRWLRVDEVHDVVGYSLRDLTPLPARVGQTGPCWAAAVRGGEIVLLIDPARL